MGLLRRFFGHARADKKIEPVHLTEEEKSACEHICGQILRNEETRDEEFLSVIREFWPSKTIRPIEVLAKLEVFSRTAMALALYRAGIRDTHQVGEFIERAYPHVSESEREEFQGDNEIAQKAFAILAQRVRNSASILAQATFPRDESSQEERMVIGRENNEATWISLFQQIEADDEDKAKEFWQIVTRFLIPDGICPTKFRANSIELIRNPMYDVLLGNESMKPTPSLRRLSSPGNRPTGYPEWFLAAYPDVVIWAAKVFSPAAIRCDNTCKSVFREVFGDAEETSEVADCDGFIKNQYLQAIIKAYRKYVGLPLECGK